jgi:hypothetical protein
VVEAGAGVNAGYRDADYVEKGAKLAASRAEVFQSADVLLQVLSYSSNDVTGKDDLALYRRDQTVIGFHRPLGSLESAQQLAATGVTSFSVELMPRITRAQSMDALSSMATICGYKAVLLAGFIGFEVIRRVSPLLHTPLMSLTNALDAIAVVGAIVIAGEAKSTFATVLGTIAIVAAMSNVVGGFLITDRMPGHMNVLLAEADIPCDRRLDMDSINPDFPQTDVVLVIGANDVTNPAARTDQSSPIFGMPILDVDKARTVMVIKRSMNPGFAGIDNPLYYLDKTLMLFGDAKGFVGDIVRELTGGSGH